MKKCWSYDLKGRMWMGAFACIVMCAPAQAASESLDASVVVSSQLSLVSDYVWRGLSQTWGRPAAQISVSASHESGAYASFFASNVAAQFVPNGSLEMDFGAGYKHAVGQMELDMGGTLVLYPGANFNKASFSPAFESSDPRTFELYMGATWSALNVKVAYIPTKFYGWNTNNSGVNGVFNSEHPNTGLTGDSSGAINFEGTYTYAANARLSIQATLGRQIIPNSRGINWNYGRLGVMKTMNSGWSFGVAASATSNPEAFLSYGSLTNNGQRSTPSRSTVIFTVSKQI